MFFSIYQCLSHISGESSHGTALGTNQQQDQNLNSACVRARGRARQHQKLQGTVHG